MGNEKWIDKFPTAMAMFMNEGIFYHTFVLIRVHKEISIIIAPFKYFYMWSMVGEFSEKVKRAWSVNIVGCAMFQTVQKLKIVKQMLNEMNIEGFLQIHICDIKASLALKEAQIVLHQNSSNTQASELEHRFSRGI